MITLLTTLARAQDSEPAPADEQVTVYGEAVERARQEVVDQVVGLGYDRAHRRDDRTVYRNDAAWKGKVVVYDDGRVATRRTGIRGHEVEPIAGTRIRPYFLCVVNLAYCFEAGSWYVAPARWRQTEDAVAKATAAPLEAWGDRMADAALAQKLALLPDALDGLWLRGEPIDGGPALATWEERRAALLAYWDTRTETAWGELVRDAVAGYVRSEVQRGEHPYTAREQADFDARRLSLRPFPWTLDAEPADQPADQRR